MSSLRAGRSCLAVVAASWLIFPAVGSAAPARNADRSGASPTEKVRKALDQTISLELADQRLDLAIAQLRDLAKINFILDRTTIQQMGIMPEESAVTLKVEKEKVRSALRALLGQYNLGYAIIGDTVLITSEEMALYRQMRQRINVHVERVALQDALKDLARDTATNLVMDPRLTTEAQTAVSLSLDDVPLEVAVRLMAEMGGLRPVRIGNVLFVTTKANAVDLRSDPEAGPPALPGSVGEQVVPRFGGIAPPPAVAAPPVPPPPPAPPPAPPAPPIRPEKKPAD